MCLPLRWCLIGVLLAAPSAWADEPRRRLELRQRFEIGEAYYDAEAWDDAARVFRSTLRDDPGDAQAAAYLALIERRKNAVAPPPPVQQRDAAMDEAMIQALKEHRQAAMDQALARAAGSVPAAARVPASPPRARQPAPGIPAPAAPPFRSYVVEKSAEELQEEEAQHALARQAEAAPLVPEGVPESARPSLDLHNTVSYSYLDPRIGPPDRQLVLSTSGSAGDFDVLGYYSRKDLSGTFRNDYAYLDFTRPDLFVGLFEQATGLTPLRGQTDQLRGIKTRKAWSDRHATTVAAGWTDNVVSGTAGSGTFLGSLYEVQEEVAPLDWLRLRSAVFFTENEADLEALRGTGDIPRHNVITFGETVLQPWGPLTLSGQAAHAHYDLDRAPDEPISDWNLRGEAAWRGAHGQLRYTYEFVGDQYASIGNPAVYQDFAGWNLNAGYRLTDRWSVFGNLARFRDNVSDDPAAITQQNLAWTLSTQMGLPRDQAVTLSFTDNLGNPSGPNAPSSNRSHVSRVDYIRPFVLDTRLLLNYQFSQNLQPAGSNSDAHEVGGSLFKGFPGGSSLFLSHQLRVDSLETEEDMLASTTSFTANYQLRRDLGLYLNTAYTRNATEGSRGVDTLSGSLGARVQWFEDMALTAEYRVNTYDLGTERGRGPHDWSVFFLISRYFGLMTAPAFGRLEGRIGQDLNHDGILAPGEPGVEGLTVRLADARTAVTAPDGRFSFVRIAPGTTIVTVDPGSLPVGWALPDHTRRVPVKRSERVRAEFPLLQVASIEGRVFIDENADGTFQETEEPLEGVAVVLQPGNQFRRTDAEGLFRFDELLPAAYTVQLYAADLPTGYAPASPEILDVPVGAGEERADVGFAIRLNRTQPL